MRKFAFVIVAALSLGGCAGQSALVGGPSLTASIVNPVGRNELAIVENSYGLALTAAVNYRRLGICPRGTTEGVSRICARRSVVLQLQAADRKVRVALLAARKFVRNNPTLNAFSVIDAARAAVDDFRVTLAANGVQ